ncbi:MAG: 16S rRNA (cytosine(1402)-N(4))-methyltransferase RsmH [Succinivibrio dextrinosolvens]|uniref:Ribosomal RNA small subunit methyltransferase H n=1 Tax=Succinivibrio dextrinosolvens TaxID=83771 RepID=A0A662ZDJ7_9GAMM|nr:MULTISPECIES: 16S rRNA (cytosine(1402)-N(4))-methyltransferase RsmH [Succinivibrio]MBQ9221163.1 16S rRNA (cytosine(1402)-N(4))-methyltransferase RsmH [Succinivibrio sp.]MDY6420188.1 16S rRNA (cytosine(1402)-N(4))-methyltransferase RsmH [Succinivibrio dextrinosolvens]MDY6465375.1 16S rRNA (cytosine(1402)-N(4))-methyltransferase RsmH [Succinivibrio dextrinosolvens]MDY6469677.1 16S rRNA (cytosine(1402)-N(4))-methyltransferase RsmH [Succinivibrio dextrinosolvens]SFK35263.1 16S rRNA (cytosine140
MAFSHIPVLLNEVLDGLDIKPDGIYVDATFGRGGHSRKILERLGPSGRLYGLDRDLTAVEAAKEIKDERFCITHSAFSNILEVCERLRIAGKVDGILMDIGVSSPQIDDPSRGFSFEKDGPLDMRMDQSAKLDAKTIVNTYSKQDLAYIFKVYGEENFASKVAAAIVRDREKKPFETTLELSEFIKRVIGGKPTPKHKATRCFQALRIAVNGELDELKKALDSSLEVLADNGRLCVISFHSLEDRIVKTFIKDKSQGQKVPNGLPLTFEETEKMRLATAKVEPVGGAIKATAEEIESNVRSRSATLRVCRRLKRQP